MARHARKTKDILVVDNTRTQRERICALLARYGYGTRVAANAEDALRELGAGPETDLVVVDLLLPGMDGIEFAKQVRSQQRFRDLPILVTASGRNVNRVMECLGSGCSDFLVKPVNPRLLFQRVQGLIESHPRNYHRVPCQVLVEMSTGRTASTGEMREVGEGGASCFLTETPDLGDLVRISFTLPGEAEPLVVGGEVAYVLPQDEGTLCGLKFVILDRETRAAIGRFVEQAAPA